MSGFYLEQKENTPGPSYAPLSILKRANQLLCLEGSRRRHQWKLGPSRPIAIMQVRSSHGVGGRRD